MVLLIHQSNFLLLLLRFLSMWALEKLIVAMNPHTLEEFEASIRREIDCILETKLIHLTAHFLKRRQKCVEEGGQHF